MLYMRLLVSESTTWHICAWLECENKVAHRPSDRRKREYCSKACKQKAYRQRQREAAERNTSPVTINTYAQVLQTLDTFTPNQLKSLKDRIDIKLKQPTTNTTPSSQATPIRYFRKGAGVVHLTVSGIATFCGRDVEQMREVSHDEGRICQRCAQVRDNHTWWHNWRA